MVVHVQLDFGQRRRRRQQRDHRHHPRRVESLRGRGASEAACHKTVRPVLLRCAAKAADWQPGERWREECVGCRVVAEHFHERRHLCEAGGGTVILLITPSPSLLKHLLKVEGAVQQNNSLADGQTPLPVPGRHPSQPCRACPSRRCKCSPLRVGGCSASPCHSLAVNETVILLHHLYL